jgi:hypothetical protein
MIGYKRRQSGKFCRAAFAVQEDDSAIGLAPADGYPFDFIKFWDWHSFCNVNGEAVGLGKSAVSGS